MAARAVKLRGLLPLLLPAVFAVGGCGASEGAEKLVKSDNVSNQVVPASAEAVPASAVPVDDAAALPPQLGQQWLDKASLSFSPVKFGTTRTSIKPALVRVVENNCDQVEDCTYVDREGVEYYFWEADELVFKFINVERFRGRDIPAFDIGRVRSKDDVLKRVETFFDGARPLCEAHEEYGSKIACELDMGEGWTKLFFDGRDQLVYIRLDMAQIN